MRGLGMVLLTGAAAIVMWKLFAVLFVGLLGMAFKVALVFAVVYFLMQVFQGRKKEEE
ncbi:MAG: hypothetical protein ACWGSQ_03730 [Longimicrobiales bacterium]